MSQKQKWTPEMMPDYTGKVIVVTGANSGLGFEAVREFARRGGRIVMACRNLEKGDAALSQLRTEQPAARAELLHLDLGSLAGIRRFVGRVEETYDRLDVLLNNAGIMAVPYGTTEDGLERQMGVNHLGHFALTGLLMDRLRAAEGARIVTVSSNAHRSGTMDFDNFLFEAGKDYTPMAAYGRSKLANLLFTLELQRRLEADRSSALAAASHPGLAFTNLAEHLQDRWYFKAAAPLLKLLGQNAHMGTLPSLRAASDPEIQGGEYFGPGGFVQLKGYPEPVAPAEAARDAEAAKTLWSRSEELTGVRYFPASELNS